MARYGIIGFGCAGYYGAKAIRENDPDGEIVVFSEHMAAPYNPMLTTYYVAGKIPFEAQFPFGSMEKVAEELNLQDRAVCYTDRPKSEQQNEHSLHKNG